LSLASTSSLEGPGVEDSMRDASGCLNSGREVVKFRTGFGFLVEETLEIDGQQDEEAVEAEEDAAAQDPEAGADFFMAEVKTLPLEVPLAGVCMGM
jgi:hypothetical protein